MKIAIMIALLTVNAKIKQQEVDALGFQTLKKCQESLEPIKRELLKSVYKVELACVERDLY